MLGWAELGWAGLVAGLVSWWLAHHICISGHCLSLLLEMTSVLCPAPVWPRAAEQWGAEHNPLPLSHAAAFLTSQYLDIYTVSTVSRYLQSSVVPAVISWEKCGQTNTLLELVSVRSDLVIATPLQPWWFFLNLLFCFLPKKSFMKVCRISADYRNIKTDLHKTMHFLQNFNLL